MGRNGKKSNLNNKRRREEAVWEQCVLYWKKKGLWCVGVRRVSIERSKWSRRLQTRGPLV